MWLDTRPLEIILASLQRLLLRVKTQNLIRADRIATGDPRATTHKPGDNRA